LHDEVRAEGDEQDDGCEARKAECRSHNERRASAPSLKEKLEADADERRQGAQLDRQREREERARGHCDECRARARREPRGGR